MFLKRQNLFKILISLILCLSFQISSVNSIKLSRKIQENFNVIGVVEVIRHGARTPLLKGKTAEIYYGTESSQLTINGFRQHILLGRWIRRRYIKGEVSKLFHHDVNEINLNNLEIISSSRQRSIFSTSAHVLGIIPKAIIKLNLQGHQEIKNNDIPPIKDYHEDIRDGREVTINVQDPDKDNLFMSRECHFNGEKKTLIQIARARKEDLFHIKKSEIRDAVDDILHHYGDIVHERAEQHDEVEKYTLKNLKKLISFIRPFKYHLDVKLAITSKTIRTMKKFVLNKVYNYRLKESREKKLFASGMFDKIYKFFNSKIHQESTKKMIIMSAFDNTIVDLILNIFHPNFIHDKIEGALENEKDYSFLTPPLASSFIFELIRVKGKYFVRLVYNGNILYGKFIVKVNQLKSGLISWNEFERLLASRIDEDYLKLNCNNPSNHHL